MSPFTDVATTAAAISTDNVYSGKISEVSVHPNPVLSGTELSISLPEGSAGEVQVDISSTGLTIQTENLYAADIVNIQLKASIAPGIYLVNVMNNRKRWREKILVK